MQIEQFLARVVPPGAFLAVAYTFKREGQTGTAFANRFFKHDDLGDAAGFLRYQAVRRSNDTYYALASYKTAVPNGQDKLGRTKFVGERKQNNTHQLRAFWMDLDVSRPGDGKDPANVFATRDAARQWLKGFLVSTGLVLPNMMVNSGYGYHAYWLLEDPMSTEQWQPYAHALRHAMDQHGYKGDAGITIDSARVLRPPETFNMKSGQPVPVATIDKYHAADYPNPLVLDKLQPFVGLTTVAQQATSAAAGAATGTTHVLAGGSTVQQLRPANKSMAAAMSAGTHSARPRYFQRISERCEQVKLSLANHGKGEDRPLWYLGNITLAVLTIDGASFVHPFSDGDARYNQQNVDQHFRRAQAEHASKGNGPPTCAHYDRVRPGVCQTCPFSTKVTTPWQLGLDQPDDTDLPDRYRRNNGSIEYAVPHPKDGLQWFELMVGDVSDAQLVNHPRGGFIITFLYYREDKTYSVQATTEQITPDPGAVYKHFQGQGLLVHHKLELQLRAFILSWIEKLRTARALRDDVTLPFGWSIKDGDYKSFSVAGTVYHPDGSESIAPGGDPTLVRDYTPAGSLAKWSTACNFVMKDRVDLQVIISVAFGSPLMTFTGHAGVLFSAWSQQSAVGKTSAMKIGRAVWSSEVTNQSLDDTNNSALARLGITRNLPSWWDEMRGNTKDKAQAISDLALAFTQGKGKSRLSSGSTLLPVDEWQTMLMCASNYPLMEHIIAATRGTDAGAVRMFEWQIDLPQMPNSAAAARVIQLSRFNYGHAGRVYAKFLATHIEKVIQLVVKVSDQLTDELQPRQEERFFIAGIACNLVGAKIANRLGLCQFDINAMHAMLSMHFLRLRDERLTATLINGKGADLEQILALFMADRGQHKLITTRFSTPGSNRYTGRIPETDIKWAPTDRRRVDIHISQVDQTIRISRPVFNKWCHDQGFPATAIINEMLVRWRATVNRCMLAAGTGYSQGQVMCIDIPTRLPVLADYLLAPAPVQQVAPTPGNQPRV